MKVVIPMSGFGERFRSAGYTVPKPLIEVEGKPIIAHVVDLFPGEEDVVFICNQDHLETTPMANILKRHCPTGEIISVSPHKKGPVYAVAQAFDTIDDDTPTIVNYCDFTCYWDYHHFKQWVADCGAQGCVPAYRGFHPHSLGSTNYAFMRVQDLWMSKIQEKQPFTSNKIDEFASSGTYYFAKGCYVKQFFGEVMKREIHVNNEYYCSMAYNLMVEAGLSVSVYELQHFMQWGTPQDLAEYCRWSEAFRSLLSPTLGERQTSLKGKNNNNAGTTLIPMAGRGSRFSKAGYLTPKPLIPVSARPMVVQATASLPTTDHYNFVCLQEHIEQQALGTALSQQFSTSTFTVLEDVTSGQACTCLAALDDIDDNSPLTISACDHGILFDTEKFSQTLADTDVDCIVWVSRGHPGAIQNPEMYGWVAADEHGTITAVSVKQPLSDPATDSMIIGTFTFKRPNIFEASAQRLIDRDGRVNGELYVDTCLEDVIALGYRCVIFEVEHYICWGTPDDLKTFKYWQSCFHKWDGHPYRWEHDIWNPSTGVSIQQPFLAPVYPPQPRMKI